MREINQEWTLLVYRVPPQPSRLRLQIWRKLQQMGVLYLQDAVCLVPARPDLTENMQYIAQMVEEMRGTYHLFTASPLLTGGAERLADGFRSLADSRLDEIIERLDKAQATLQEADDPAIVDRIEEELKRERVAYLRARRLAYCGSTQEAVVEAGLDALQQALDDMYRSGK